MHAFTIIVDKSQISTLEASITLIKSWKRKEPNALPLKDERKY